MKSWKNKQNKLVFSVNEVKKLGIQCYANVGKVKWKENSEGRAVSEMYCRLYLSVTPLVSVRYRRIDPALRIAISCLDVC